MAWDPTFDWTDAESFNGEARKLAILVEMITQINIKCVESSSAEMNVSVAGDPLNILIDFNDKLSEVAVKFYDHIAADGSKWTIAKLEAEIGISRPSVNIIKLTPIWINWMYQAIELLLYSALPTQYRITFNTMALTLYSYYDPLKDPACDTFELGPSANPIGFYYNFIGATVDLDYNDNETFWSKYGYIHYAEFTGMCGCQCESAFARVELKYSKITGAQAFRIGAYRPSSCSTSFEYFWSRSYAVPLFGGISGNVAGDTPACWSGLVPTVTCEVIG